MKELCTIMARIYEYGPWRIEIYADPESTELVWEVWLWHNDCGIKDFMFGLPKYDSEGKEQHKDYDEVLAIVEANLPQYIKFYDDEFIN